MQQFTFQRGSNFKFHFDGEGLPPAVSGLVERCSWTACHPQMRKYVGGFLVSDEGVSEWFPGGSEGFAGFPPHAAQKGIQPIM